MAGGKLFRLYFLFIYKPSNDKVVSEIQFCIERLASPQFELMGRGKQMSKKTATQDDGLIVISMLVAMVALFGLGMGMLG